MKPISKFITWAVTVLICTVQLEANTGQVDFSFENINKLKSEAAKEGKLIFVDFYAHWCTPCQWMDKTTFSDEEIVHSLNNNFLTFKADIDSPEGYELKEIFDIKYLPTLLILNADGRVLDRVEQTMPPDALKAWLEKYSTAEGHQIVKHEFNVAPAGKSISSSNAKTGDLPSLSTVYRVQVGVFQRYESAIEMVRWMKQLFDLPVTVVNEIVNEVPLYKVRIGEFRSRENADRFKGAIAEDYKMDGIVL